VGFRIDLNCSTSLRLNIAAVIFEVLPCFSHPFIHADKGNLQSFVEEQRGLVSTVTKLRFHKRRGIYRVAEGLLLVSEERRLLTDSGKYSQTATTILSVETPHWISSVITSWDRMLSPFRVQM
jgi:hypothetical protein